MDPRASIVLALALGACGGEKRAAQAPPSASSPVSAATPAVVDSPSLQPFQQEEANGGLWGFRRADGSVVITPRFAWTQRFREGLARVYDDSTHTWGYIDATGALIIPYRFGGAGDFDHGTAPVQDSLGYALIDRAGRVVDRFSTDSAIAGSMAVVPPSTSDSTVQEFAQHLERGAGTARYAIDLEPRPGESQGAAVVSRLASGVVVIDEHQDDGWSLQVVLPGVSAEQANAWLLKIRNGRPLETGDGCEERWETRAVRGGALLHDSGGC